MQTIWKWLFIVPLDKFGLWLERDRRFLFVFVGVAVLVFVTGSPLFVTRDWHRRPACWGSDSPECTYVPVELFALLAAVASVLFI